MVPVLGREVEEGEQSFPVLGQAGDCLVVLGAVLIGEHIDGRLGCRAGRRTVNFTKVCLHVDLDREGYFVQHVGGLVNPTPLVPGTRKDLLDGLPEAERAVADRQVGRDLEPTLLDVDEEFAPALCALPHSGLETDQFLLALRGRTDQHEDAFGGRFHRSEEHTSELQSQSNLVCRLLLEKKKKNIKHDFFYIKKKKLTLIYK